MKDADSLCRKHFFIIINLKLILNVQVLMYVCVYIYIDKNVFQILKANSNMFSTRSEPIAPDNQSMFDHIPDISLQPTDIPADASSIVPSFNPLLDDGPPSVAPFSVAPPSVAPPSVAPGMVSIQIIL